VSKEAEVIPAGEPIYTEVNPDVEVPPGMGEFIQKTSETIDLPADVRKMGVTEVGPSAPLVEPAVEVKLPISDVRVEQGLHAPVVSNFRWLAQWCLRQLQKAHLHLKKLTGGAIVREHD
jgi:hypothetical protein